MTWTMDFNDVEHLTGEVVNGDQFDVFGISNGLGEEDHHHTETLAGICEDLTEFLEGRDRTRQVQIENSLRRFPRNRLDRITAELACHLGMVPAVAVALANPIGGATFADNVCDRDFIIQSPEGIESETVIGITAAITWGMNGILSIDGLPLQIAQSIGRQPLAGIVSHPVLDRYPLTITEAHTLSIGNRVILVIEGAPPILTTEELLAMRPD